MTLKFNAGEIISKMIYAQKVRFSVEWPQNNPNKILVTHVEIIEMN